MTILEQRIDQESPPTPQYPQSEEAIRLWQDIHKDLVEWMTEGTHPYRAPRADHG